MPVVKDTGPVPGTLRAVVIKANGLRANAAGGLTSPMVRLRMRPVANPRAQDVPLFETRTVSSNCDPEWEEEFHLPVNDANQSQLEVTVWDTAETQAFPAPFMGECILNLSKLVPYQGEIIMQDFDVKQGKQHKTQVLAAGKLILQLELTGGEIAPALPAPPAPVQQPSVVLPPGKEKFVMNLVVVEARDLSKVADDPDSYVCLTLLDDPQSMQTSHFHALDHGIGQTSREIIVLTPQHRTKICPSNLNPTWNDGCTLAEAHPSILLVQQAQQNGQGPADKVALVGQPVLLMFTVRNHTADCAGQNGFLGRVVLPQIRVGIEVDQWFVLQTLEGKELLGASGKPSGIRVKIYYGPASQMERIGDPYITPHPPQIQHSVQTSAPVPVRAPAPPTTHPTPARAPQASARAPVTASPIPTPAVQEATGGAPSFPVGSRPQTPDPWARPPTPQIVQTLAGTPFAFYVELVEARNLSKSGGDLVTDPYACISLFCDPASMEKKHFFLIDHYLPSEAEDVRFLQLPPQHVSKCIPGSASPVWNDGFTLKATHPGIQTILDLKNQQQLTTIKEYVELAGQTVLMLVTVHDANAQAGGGFCGRVVMPQIRVGQPVDQWFMLHGRDGSQIKDASGQDAAVRLRFAYGAVKDPNPELPPGWEKKHDEVSGKVFYVNHELKTFSWTPPPRAAGPTQPYSSAQKAGSHGQPSKEHTPTGHTTAEPEVAAPATQPGGEKSESPRGSNSATKVCILIKQAKDLPRMDHLSLSNAYVCVSIIGDADKIDEDARLRLQHDVSKNKLRAGLRSSMLKFYPLHKTDVVNRSLNPKWNETIELPDGYLNLEAIEKLQQKGAIKEGEREMLKQTPVLVLITVHHEVSGSEDTLIGRILIPALNPGQEMDEWFPLLSNDGKPQVGGMSEKPSQVHVHLKYEAAGAATRLQEQEALRAKEQERLRGEQEQEALRAQEQERLRKEEEAAKYERMRQAEEQQRVDQERLQEEEERRRKEERAMEAARQQQELGNARREADNIKRAAYEAQRALEMGHELRRPETLTAQADEPVDMQLKLALDFLVAGQPNSLERLAFEQNLIRDLSNASGLHPVNFRVQKMSPGSVIADMQIHRDPTGRGREPRDVAMDLCAQAKNPDSSLRNGILTCYTEAISFPALRLESIAISPKSSPTSKALPAAKDPPKPSMHQAKLFISVLQATNLTPTERNGTCHFLCELAFEASGRETPIGRTGTVVGLCDPRWEQHFVCGVDADQILHSALNISVVDWNPKTQSRLVGRVRKLPLSDLVKQGKTKTWFDLFTEEGFRVANTGGQASIQVALEYEAPFVQASLLASPILNAGQPVANLPKVVQDTLPLISMYSDETFAGPGEDIRSNRQGSPMLKALPANTAPLPPLSPKSSPLPPVANSHSPALSSAASSPSESASRSTIPLAPSDPKMQEAGVGIILSVGPRSEYFVDSLLEGGPAAQSNKIFRGDILEDVDGLSIVGMPLSEVQRMLAGETHSPVTMTLLRPHGSPHVNGPHQVIVTLCRKKLVAPPAARSGKPNTSSIIGSTDLMIVPTSRPIAVRSAAPPPVAPPFEPALEGTLFDDKALMDNAASRYRAAAEAQRRADELLRKEQEAVARGAKNKNADPFAHLKEEFAELIHDLYGSQNDTAMAAALEWKKKLLYGNMSANLSMPMEQPVNAR